jgi:hypothetical protein
MNLLAMRDTGSLVVGPDSMSFQGRKYNVLITAISRITIGKQGRDFMNDWVKVEFDGGQTAFFADGSMLGWGGIFGGTRRIFDSVIHLAPRAN